MMLNVKTKLKQLGSDDVLVEQGEEWTVGKALLIAAMSPPEPTEKPYEAETHVLRWKIGSAIKAALDSTTSDGMVDVPLDLLVALKKDVCRRFSPIVAGQIMPYIEGST